MAGKRVQAKPSLQNAGGGGYLEERTCGVDGDPSHEQELPLITPPSMVSIPEAGTEEAFPILALQNWWNRRAITINFSRLPQITERKRLILTVLPTI